MVSVTLGPTTRVVVNGNACDGGSAKSPAFVERYTRYPAISRSVVFASHLTVNIPVAAATAGWAVNNNRVSLTSPLVIQALASVRIVADPPKACRPCARV